MVDRICFLWLMSFCVCCGLCDVRVVIGIAFTLNVRTITATTTQLAPSILEITTELFPTQTIENEVRGEVNVEQCASYGPDERLGGHVSVFNSTSICVRLRQISRGHG